MARSKEEERLEDLRTLCEQADQLRAAAAALCEDLTKRIKRSRRIIAGRTRKKKRWKGQERRKLPRN